MGDGEAFWRNKRVLVTGHTGFKGSWLCLWLQELGAELCGIALDPPTSPSLFEIAKIQTCMRHEAVDIRDLDKITGIVNQFKPEVIFHMAAQPLVRHSYLQPIETYSTNIMGTINVFEAARASGTVRSIVNVTTDKCYENKEWAWGYRENEPMGGDDPYSSSKGCAELISHAYRQSFFTNSGIGLATARAGNVIGGGDWAHDRLVPDILRSLQLGCPVSVRNPSAVRPWQHVLEPLGGYLILAEKLYNDPKSVSEGWNFGPKDEDSKTVEWIVSNLCHAWGKHAPWERQSGDHPHEAVHLKLDISKAKQRLNWLPRWDLEVALKKIVSWQKSWLSGDDMRKVTLGQIREYRKIQGER